MVGDTYEARGWLVFKDYRRDKVPYEDMLSITIDALNDHDLPDDFEDSPVLVTITKIRPEDVGER